MKLLRKMTAFILAFCLTAGTVAVMSAAVYDEHDSVSVEDETIAPAIPPEFEVEGSEDSDDDLAATAAQSYTPRLTAPAKSNKYYYSDLNVFYKYGWGMPNCTSYAYGRAYEILGTEPELSRYSAYLWYGYNKDNRVYAYGNKPKLGAIACWVYSSGTSGHVAVVEKIENNTITFSNSAYSTGVEFYLSTAPVNDPSNGNSTWIFQGYIYLGDYVNDSSSAVSDPQTPSSGAVSGDVYRITAAEGVNLRCGYGTGYRAIGGIMYGQDVTVTKVVSNEGYTWGYTTYNGVSGWFVTDFAKLIYKKTSTVTKTNTPAVKPTSAPTVKPTTAPKQQPANKEIVKPTTAPTQAPTQAPKPPVKVEEPVKMMLMGDLDDDEFVTIMDATRLQMIIADLFVPTEYMLIVGDYDGDSVLSIMDSTRIRYYLAYETD